MQIDKSVVLKFKNGDKFEIAYCVDGEIENPNAIPIIFIHGLGSSKLPLSLTIMKDLLQTAKENKQSIVVYALDLPGHGNSQNFNGKLSINRTVGILLKFMKINEIESAHLYGMSAGGIICTKFAAKYPNKVLGLTLQGVPIDGNDWKFFKKYAKPLIPSIKKLMEFTNVGSKKSRALLLKVIDTLAGAKVSITMRSEDVVRINKSKDLQKALIWDIKKLSLPSTLDYAKEILSLNLYPQLRLLEKNQFPILIIDGDSPEHPGVDTLKRLSLALPRATTFVVPNTGHMVTIIESQIIANKFFEVFLNK